ncbi:hypothetical protein [Methylococcus sp. Mc7]|uniref:hypothetical protein n=1 Tax=Methylococcus sp. Mc7 TaxID=2860258 RepID=UPI002106E0B7|nr:hypothetical protein [Methylococcus sp. Mc7]
MIASAGPATPTSSTRKRTSAKKIGPRGLTEVDYFMEVFAPGYELTLDRLGL